MKAFITILFSVGLLQALAQPATATSVSSTANDDYERLRSSGKVLKTAGWFSLASGTVLVSVKAIQDLTFELPSLWGPVPETSANESAAVYWTGAALMAGGIAMLIVGGSKHKKAKAMRNSSNVGLMPYAPPAKLGKTSVSQQGITLSIGIGH